MPKWLRTFLIAFCASAILFAAACYMLASLPRPAAAPASLEAGRHRYCASRQALLDPKCVDADVAENQIRHNLGTARPDEVIIPLDGNKTDDALITEKTRAFRKVKFLYNRPTWLDYRKSNTIVLSIATADLAAAQARVTQGSGPVHTATADLADQVRASLEGDPNLVDIQLAGSPDKYGAVKTLSSAANATWSWYVTPKSLDQITLTLSLYDEVKVGGERVEIDGPVYVDKILINASFWDKWSSLLNSFWGAVIAFAGAVGGVVTAGVELLRWRRERRAEARPPAPEAVPGRKRTKKRG